MRPPIVYYGGKQGIAGQIAALLPKHTHYVEPFAGSLAVLLAKPQSPQETVNDLDGDLMTFWRMLRDEPEALARACALTPHSRSERALDRPADIPDLERARRVWVCLSQGRTGTLATTGWRFDIAPAKPSMPTRLDRYVARIEAVARRLHNVSLECRPALEVIEAYGRRLEALLYVDPPYLSSTRTSANYRCEMASKAEHETLSEALHACAASVVLSSYPCDLYDILYDDWHRWEIESSTSQGGRRREKTEVLWSNREFRYSGTEFRYICLACGQPILQPAVGRPRSYCSPACRTRAHRARAGALRNAPSARR